MNSTINKTFYASSTESLFLSYIKMSDKAFKLVVFFNVQYKYF